MNEAAKLLPFTLMFAAGALYGEIIGDEFVRDTAGLFVAITLAGILVFIWSERRFRKHEKESPDA